MVHRTDIAGTVGCSRGRVDHGDDGSCRHAPSGALVRVLSSKEVIYRIPATPYFDGEKCSRVFLTALPSVHAIYVETVGPMRR
jgi:hypothetical protein